MNFKIDHQSPVPLHAQIEQYLRVLITEEPYCNGKNLLPKEDSLAKKLGVSRNTIRAAISKLVIDGLVERKKGVGSKVVSKRISTRLDNWVSFTKEMRSQGIEVENYLVKISLVPAIKEVEEALELTEGKQIWKLEKIRGSKEAKYLYSVSYFHPRVGITGKENFHTPLYDLLEKECDVIVELSKERLRAVGADDQIAAWLEIEKGNPVLKRERVVFDTGNRPVEYNEVYYHTDYFTYDIDIKRNL